MSSELGNRADQLVDADESDLWGGGDANADQRAQVAQLVDGMNRKLDGVLQHVLQPDYRAAALVAAFERELLAQLQLEIPVPQPAAGSATTPIVVPGLSNPDDLTFWDLIGAQVQIATSGVANNRFAFIEIQDQNGNVVQRFVSAAGVPATTAGTFSFYAGLGGSEGMASGASGLKTSLTLPDPPMILMPGWQIILNAQNLDAGDQIKTVFLIVRDWNPSKVANAINNMERRFAAGFDLPGRRRYPA